MISSNVNINSSSDYKRYIIDIDIAEYELLKMKLLPESRVADFYCVPSFNNQSYYVIMSEKNGKFIFTYINPQIVMPNGSIDKSVSFENCEEANSNLPFIGNLYIGIKDIPYHFVENLLNIFDNLPNDYCYDDNVIQLDGVNQGIRVYSNCIKKTVLYRDASDIPYISNKDAVFLNSLYLEIEKIIEG